MRKAKRALPDTKKGRQLEMRLPPADARSGRAKAKPNHEEREHAPLPPSASSRWLNCLPSQEYIRRLIATKNISKRVSGPAAQRGTRIHELAEPVIKAYVEKGRSPDVSRVGVDAQEAREAQDYVDYCVRRWDEAQLLDPKARCWVEVRSVVNDDCWGSVDFAILAARRLSIIDLKSGREPAETKYNTQELIYAMGELPGGVDPKGVREVELVIWQPNADDTLPPERSKVYTFAEFQDVAELTMHGIERAAHYLRGEESFQEIQRQLSAGEWCTWCDALGFCPKAAERAQEISRESFLPVAKGEPPARPPAVESMTAKQVSQVLDRSKMFAEWLDAVKTRAMEMIQRGERVPGWKIVQSSTHFWWPSTMTPKALAKRLKLREQDLLGEPEMLSPSKLAEKYKAKRKLIDEIKTRPFAATIARESDRRPPLDNTKGSFVAVSKDPDAD